MSGTKSISDLELCPSYDLPFLNIVCVCSSVTVRAYVAMSVSTTVPVGLYLGPNCQPSAKHYS